MSISLVSWNVNGIRAAAKGSLLEFITESNANIIAFQEIKAGESDIPAKIKELDYRIIVNPARKKGYSGTAVLNRLPSLGIIDSTEIPEFNGEGRVCGIEFENFWFLNVYFPNSGRDLNRLDFKLQFDRALHKFCNSLREVKPVVICGDFNVAHMEVDIARPADNINNAGFTVQEREWMTEFLNDGYVDTFRMFNSEPGNYTWWTYRFNARSRNIGWRIDYFVVSDDLRNRVISSEILANIRGSDHCPVKMVLDL